MSVFGLHIKPYLYIYSPRIFSPLCDKLSPLQLLHSLISKIQPPTPLPNTQTHSCISIIHLTTSTLFMHIISIFQKKWSEKETKTIVFSSDFNFLFFTSFDHFFFKMMQERKSWKAKLCFNLFYSYCAYWMKYEKINLQLTRKVKSKILTSLTFPCTKSNIIWPTLTA